MRAEGPGVDPLLVAAGGSVTPGAEGVIPGEAVDGQHILISSWTTAQMASRNAGWVIATGGADRLRAPHPRVRRRSLMGVIPWWPSCQDLAT